MIGLYYRTLGAQNRAIMSITKDELAAFNRFAVEKLSNGGADTLQQLLDEWNARRAYEQSVAAIRESVAQYGAGEGLPVKDAFEEVRGKLGWIE